MLEESEFVVVGVGEFAAVREGEGRYSEERGWDIFLFG
jgi:hypothetical protein